MRLPYFYQQLLGYLAVIITLLYISFFSFYHFTRTMILDQTEDVLNNYAETLITDVHSGEDLSQAQGLLENQNYDFVVVNGQNEVILPEDKTNINPEEYMSEQNFNQLLDGQRITTTIEVADGENRSNGELNEVVIASVPFFSQESGDYSGFIGVSTPTSFITEQFDDLEKQLFRAFLIAGTLALFISVIISKHQVNRINRLRKAAHMVSDGNYDVRIEYNSRDELDDLSRDFNKMIIELEETSKEVERQEGRRKTFMQDAAHEMRTPLTTINGLLEGLEHGIIDEKNSKRSVQLMSKETKRLIRLVNENLDYENIRSNHIKLEKNLIPLSEIFEEIGHQMNKLAENSNNELIIEDDHDLTVWADFDRLKQILVNLIKNAIQFTEDGTVRVYAKKAKHGMAITVEDTGIGMSKDQIDNIYERYYKADSSRMNTRYGESGLGLSIVQQLVNLHGARMIVTSELDRGSSFCIEFPDSEEDQKELNKRRQEDIIE